MILNIDYLINGNESLNDQSELGKKGTESYLGLCIVAIWILFILLWSIYSYFDEITGKL